MSRTTWKLVSLFGVDELVDQSIGWPLTLTVDSVDMLVVASIEAAATRYGFKLELVAVDDRRFDEGES